MRRVVKLLFRQHFFGSFAIVAAVTAVLTFRVTDRGGFATSELHGDVIDRWGAPIAQAMPSVRFVPSGAVFNTLTPLPLSSQRLRIDATMNYRKRGLVYFSGFDFTLDGTFVVKNDEGRAIDAVFVLPIQLATNKVMLSDLVFEVDARTVAVSLAEGADKLVWTGRLLAEQQITFHVGFRGRGLDSFVYRLDPSARVRDFELALSIAGGHNIDYPDGVAPASETRTEGDRVRMWWRYGSLESGIPIGVVLPSEASFDAELGTMAARAWVPFVLLFVALSAVAALWRRTLTFYEAYLVGAAYALFFVLVAYWAAIMHFVVAYLLGLAVVGALLVLFLRGLFGRPGVFVALALTVAALVLPTLAVLLQGYTGLIYALESLALVAMLMWVTRRDDVRALLTSTQH